MFSSIHKFFNWLLEKKVPYTFAVAVPSVLWAAFAATFGFFLIIVKADFEATGTEGIFILTITILVLLSSLGVFLEFGLLELIGLKKKGRRKVLLLNANIIKGHVKKNISKSTLLKVYKYHGNIYKDLLYRNIHYTTTVVLICVLTELVASGWQIINVSTILIGGLIAVCFSFICTVPLYELLFSQIRRECKMLLSEKGVKFEEPAFLSLKVKSKFFVFLAALGIEVILILTNPYLSLTLVAFFLLTLLIIGILSELAFETIYRSLYEMEEAARSFKKGEKASFFTGSLDQEFIDFSQYLNVAADTVYGVKKDLEVKVKERTEELEREKKNLEKKVRERTEELRERVKTLEEFQRVTVGREIKMIELKEEIKRLKEELSEQDIND